MGINCTYDPISLSFQFFYPFVQICKIGWETFSTSHKNQDPSPLPVGKSNRMKYDSQTEWVSSHSVMISHEPHMSLKSHWCHQCPPLALNQIFHNITPQPKTIRKLLSQHSLITSAKFYYHGHQCHL